MAALHTALHLGVPQLKRIRIVPDSGTLEEGAAWLLPHVDAYNIVSFDTESCHREGGLAFSIFGAMDGYALLVDHRPSPVNRLEPALQPLIKNRLVLGSGITRQDSRMLAGLPCRLGDTQVLSKAIQTHPRYPYEACNYTIGQKSGLKLIPEMLFGHCYGPLSLVTRKGASIEDEDYQERQGFPQPFEWPTWLYPVTMYTFRSSPPSQEQIAYMYNDSVAPFLHVMLLTMLRLADESLTGVATVQEALSLTASSFFGDTVATVSTQPATSGTSKKPQFAATKRKAETGPDVWASLGEYLQGSQMLLYWRL